MNGFKLFIENEEDDNVKEIIAKLPKSHQKLLRGFKVKFTPGNTLKNDKEHVGYIHNDKIVVAAPWSMSRSFVFLHEVSHQLFEHLFTKELKKKWSDLVKSTKSDHMKSVNKEARSALDQNDEEIFAMAYANYYCKHKLKTYDHPEWMEFIKNLP